MNMSLRIPLAKAATTTTLALVVLTGTIGLTGCAADKHIREVKALAFGYPDENTPDPNLTVDQALDYRKVCDSTEWKVDMTEQHQTFVEYRCNYKDVGDSMFVARDKSDVASAGDVYQWTYGPDGQPQLSFVGFTIHFKNGTSKDFTTLPAVRVMELASENRATSFDEAFSYLTNARIPVKPSSPFKDTTYGNTLVDYYPGHSPGEAISLAYQWKNFPIGSAPLRVDALGYADSGFEGVKLYQIFPVNPADVQFAKRIADTGNDYVQDLSSANPFVLVKVLPLSPKKLFCLSERCYDENAWFVGRAPESVLSQEKELGKWVTISMANGSKVTATPNRPGNMTDSVAAALAGTPAEDVIESGRGDNALATANSAPTTVTSNSPTGTTYGNVARAFFPREEPQLAAQNALDRAIPGSNLKVIDINQQGYPVYGIECEADDRCVNDGGLSLGRTADAAMQMFPVNPADVGKSGIVCGPYVCRDSRGNVIGRSPSFHN